MCNELQKYLMLDLPRLSVGRLNHDDFILPLISWSDPSHSLKKFDNLEVSGYRDESGISALSFHRFLQVILLLVKFSIKC